MKTITIRDENSTYIGELNNGWEDNSGYHIPFLCRHDNVVVTSDGEGGLDIDCRDCDNADISPAQAVEMLENYGGYDGE